VSFIWPLSLVAFVAVPLVLGAYLFALRRRRRRAVTYSSLALLRQAVPRKSRWLRHVPIGLLLASIALLALAAARPRVTEAVPKNQTSIILALDESGSMCSTDLKPNRLAVAQKAALDYVAHEPGGTKIGLVVFNGFAELAVAPTTSRSALDKALNSLTTGPGTAIGTALLESLNAIAQVDPKVNSVGAGATIGAGQSNPFQATPNPPVTLTPERKTPRDGYVPDVIVLLTDGANNRGITPLQAAPYAVKRRVRVYTIGFGTTHPGPLACTAEQGGGFGGGGFPGGGFPGGGFPSGGFPGGFRNPLVADLPPLEEVSRMTGGLSYTARTASQLSGVFSNLPKQIAVQKEPREITWEFALFGAILVLLALGAAVRWSPYP
jgi:Ca-activated chloride channel family protein